MRNEFLLFWMISGIILGIVCGALVGLSPDHLSFILSFADFVASIFLRLLQMVVLPLIFTSIISGMISISSQKYAAHMGIRTFLYYISTSTIAIMTGLFIVNLVKPGHGISHSLRQNVDLPELGSSGFLDLLIQMIPSNIFEASADGKMLPLIFFALFFGYCLGNLKGKNREAMKSLFQAAFEGMMKMTHFIILLAPLGIWGIFTKLIATTGFEAFIPLGKYTLCVLIALLIHSCITLPLLLSLVGGSSPWQAMKAMKYALLTAFSTSSSSATLPVTIKSLEENAKIPTKVTSFVLPLGATINMDGTALYECIAVLFISQAYGMDLSFSQQMLVVFTALMTSIGAAGVPMAGLFMMSIILSAVGLPLEGIGLIIAVDRFLDMFRTTVNVWSDSCGCIIISNLNKKPEST